MNRWAQEMYAQAMHDEMDEREFVAARIEVGDRAAWFYDTPELEPLDWYDPEATLWALKWAEECLS